jgi:hypothetical protein
MLHDGVKGVRRFGNAITQMQSKHTQIAGEPQVRLSHLLFFATALLCLLHGHPTVAQESMLHSIAGADSFRPSTEQSEGINRVELSVASDGIEEEPLTGPIAKELAAHTARGIRRLFPSLKYSSTPLNRREAPPDKYLHIGVEIHGSGLNAKVCAVHASITLHIIYAEHKEKHETIPATITLAAPRQIIIPELKKAITLSLETAADGWHEPFEDGKTYFFKLTK